MPNKYNINGMEIANTPETTEMLRQKGLLDTPTPEPVTQVETPAPMPDYGSEPLLASAAPMSTPAPDYDAVPMETPEVVDDSSNFAPPPTVQEEAVVEKTGLEAIADANNVETSFENLKQAQTETAKLETEASAEAQALYTQQQEDLNKMQTKQADRDAAVSTAMTDAVTKYEDATKEIDDILAADPKKITLMDGMGEGVGNKIMGYLGLFLGGVSGGLNRTGRNPALEILKTKMNGSLAQQRMDHEKALAGASAKADAQKSVYSFMMDKFQNERVAMGASRKFLMDKMQNNLMAMSLKYKAPEIQANLTQAIAKLDVEKAKIDNDLKKQLYAQSLKMEERTVPGVGTTRTSMQAKELNLAKIAAGETKKAINRLLEINKIPFKSMRPEVIAEATQLQSKLKAQSRIAVTGGGNMSDFEQKLLADLSPNPSDFFTLESSTKKKLETLEKMVNESVQQKSAQYISKWESPQAKRYWSLPKMATEKERKMFAGMQTKVPSFKPTK